MASEIVNKILISKKPIPKIPEEWKSKSVIEILFGLITNDDANRDWLVNADTKEVIQIKEIKDKTLQVAQQLKLHGFGIGQTVHILCPNSINFHVIVFGVWLLGKTQEEEFSKIRKYSQQWGGTRNIKVGKWYLFFTIALFFSFLEHCEKESVFKL